MRFPTHNQEIVVLHILEDALKRDPFLDQLCERYVCLANQLVKRRNQILSRGRPSRLLVVTGKRVTMQTLRPLWPGAFVGASGRCAVALCSAGAADLYSFLRSKRLSHSCTNVRAVFRYDGRIGSSSSVRGLRSSIRRPLVEVLRRLHPSVVLLQPDVRTRKLPEFLYGYRVMLLQPDGYTLPSAGFGADPSYGWPGDYLI